MADSGIVQHQFTNIHVVFVRNYPLANIAETFGSACILPQWHVAKDYLRLWFDLSSQPVVRQWQLLRGQSK